MAAYRPKLAYCQACRRRLALAKGEVLPQHMGRLGLCAESGKKPDANQQRNPAVYKAKR